MNCGIPYCHTGCPVNNQIPDWNDLVYHDNWREALAQPALDQQLPGVHRPRLPGALRGLLHAQPRGHAGHHQDDRMRHRRHAAGHEGWIVPEPPKTKTGKTIAHRSAPARPASPPPSSSRAPATTSMSTRRQARAGGLLRYGIPDFKMEKSHHRPPRRADGGRGRRLPLRRQCRRRRRPGRAAARTTTRWC